MERYLTIEGSHEAELCERRSRFLALLTSAVTEEEAMEAVQQMRAKYHDAKHHVFAYRLHDGRQRYSDDGEPQGTGGQPILKVLEGAELTDCVVVVTRYFGGILLGTGGLTRAYSGAASLVLQGAKRVEMRRCALFVINMDYSLYGAVQPLICTQEGQVLDTGFGADVTIKFCLPLKKVPCFERALADLTNGSLKMVQEGEQYFPFYR